MEMLAEGADAGWLMQCMGMGNATTEMEAAVKDSWACKQVGPVSFSTRNQKGLAQSWSHGRNFGNKSVKPQVLDGLAGEQQIEVYLSG